MERTSGFKHSTAVFLLALMTSVAGLQRDQNANPDESHPMVAAASADGGFANIPQSSESKMRNSKSLSTAEIDAEGGVLIDNQALLGKAASLPATAEIDPLPITIVMADNRPLFSGPDVPADMGGASWRQLTAAINLQYAKTHNYKFVYFTYAEDHCTANLQDRPVRRHPSWCKLLAIQHVANLSPDRGFVLWLDSDAMFFDHARNFESFLQSAGFEDDGKQVDAVEGSRLKSEAPFFAFKNDPWGHLPCTGVQAWRLPLPAKFLAQWWSTETKPDRHDKCEQTALWEIYPAWKRLIGVFDVSAFPNIKCEFPSEGQYIRHFSHVNCDQQAAIASTAGHIIPPGFSSLLGELKDKYLAVLSKEEMGNAAEALEAK